MSLFKERSANAKKLISLENTIIALKKQIQEMKSPKVDTSEWVSKKDHDALLSELEVLKAELAELKKKPAPKKRGPKKKAAKEDLTFKD